MRVLKFRMVNQAEEFIRFWSNRYGERGTRLDVVFYDVNIGQPLNEDRVWKLFKWKNGTEQIAAQKELSIRNVYLPELAAIPILNTQDEGRLYLERLEGGPIWGIFWLHCINPSLFPIFDKHTYRAMAAMKNMAVREIPKQPNEKIAAYFEHYIPFIADNFQEIQDRRSIDKALFVYGRFLKTKYVP